MPLVSDQVTTLDDQQLPLYTAEDEGDFYQRVERDGDPADLPLTISPTESTFDPAQRDRNTFKTEPYSPQERLYIEILASFFAAVRSGNTEIVREFISRGLVSPDVVLYTETPLLAAVRQGNHNIPMISTLVSLGAQIDKYGSMVENPEMLMYYPVIRLTPDRTPLQLAAEKGYLAMVKVLKKDYGADDSLIAPDGALALRLAAENGHREIVDFLPTRRGGAWRRWRVAHEKEMKIVRKALGDIKEFLHFIFWKVPKFLAWTVPKELARWTVKEIRWLIKQSHKFPGWCKSQIVKFPGRVKRASKHIWSGMKKVPKAVKNISKWAWKTFVRFIKAIPGAMKIFFNWVWKGAKATGNAIGRVGMAFVSLIHTVFSSILSFFQRITLKDIGRGIAQFFRALFVDFPKAVGKFIIASGKMSYEFLAALFGCMGKLVWYMIQGIAVLIVYVPYKLGVAVVAMFRAIGRGFQEILVFFNPKIVSAPASS